MVNRLVSNLQGLVKAVGVSNYGPRQLERIYTYLERRGIPLASAQACMQTSFTMPAWAVPAVIMRLYEM